MAPTGPESRHLISGAIVVLCVLIIYLAGQAARDAVLEYRTVKRMSTTKEVVDDLIQSDILLAEERGLTSLALGLSAHDVSGRKSRILALRQRADAAWSRAMELTQALADNLHSGTALEQALAAARDAHHELNRLRRLRDQALAGKESGLQPRPWFNTATEFIHATARLRQALFATIPTPPEFVRLNQYIKAWAWEASERAGWERGTLAYYIAAGQPVPEPVLTSLRANADIAQRALQPLQDIGQDPHVPAGVRAAVAGAERSFMEGISPMRDQVYAATWSGDYPVDATTWWTRYTGAIDQLLKVSRAASAAADMQAASMRRMALVAAAGYILLALASVGLVVFSLTRVRDTALALFHHKELAEVTLHSIGDAVITTDRVGRVQYLNPVAEELTGWATREAQGRALSQIFHIIDGQTGQRAVNPVNHTLATGQVVHLPNDTVLVARTGRRIPVDDSSAPIRDRSGAIVGAVLVFYDVSENSPHAEHLLSYHATHDSLTQLVNRREFERRLAATLEQTRQEGDEHALCYLDLDQFKVINDTCGHAAGDRLLRQLSYLLETRVRETDTFARLGGDEFGLLLVDCPLECAEEIAQDLLDVAQEFRFVWEERPFEVGLSIGLVPLTEDIPGPQEALSRADTACFLAKEKGRRRVQVYGPGDDDASYRHQEMHWVARINNALQHDRLELDYQLIVPLQGQAGYHGEMLVRMLDEDGERALPAEFIPAAERYDLMPKIDRWVIRSAIAAMGQYDWTGDGGVTQCNINLSGMTLGTEGLGEYIRQQLQTAGVPPERVCFEITETAAIANFDTAARLIGSLRGIGCRFALDDFGSGLSSFGYLRNLPVDYLKIDGSLVRNLDEDLVAESMVRAIHGVARSMGIQTVAEFVTSDAIRERLTEIGIDYGQGFGLARPRPVRSCLTEACEA